MGCACPEGETNDQGQSVCNPYKTEWSSCRYSQFPRNPLNFQRVFKGNPRAGIAVPDILAKGEAAINPALPTKARLAMECDWRFTIWRLAHPHNVTSAQMISATVMTAIGPVRKRPVMMRCPFQRAASP